MATSRIAAAVMTALALGAPAAEGQLKGAKGAKLALVEAMCETGVGTGAKCNPTTFLSGTVSFRTAKQPLLYTAPDVTKLVAASIKVKGLMPPPGSAIDCEQDATTTFGDDADGNCILAGLRVYGPAAIGTVPCSGGDCWGTLHAVTTLPDGGCTDVKITVERPEVACWTSGNIGVDSEKLVQNGLVVLPAEDCEERACY